MRINLFLCLILTNKKRNVLFIPAWYPSRLDAMPGLFVRYHAEAVSLFCNVSVLHLVAESNKNGASIEPIYQDDGLIKTLWVYYYKTENKYLKFTNHLRFVLASLKGYSLIAQKSGAFDLHHVHVLTRSAFVPLLLKLLAKKPYIITEHWSRYQDPKNPSYQGVLKKFITKLAVKHAFAVCPVNAALAAAMQNRGLVNKNYFPVFNVVNLNRFTIREKPFGCNKLLHVSCFDEKAKNVMGLLRSYKDALNSASDLSLTLVGTGPDWEACVSYAQELNLQSKTHFKGQLEGEALVETFKTHDALILSSNYENQPVVIIEAFACGTPVISTEVGGIKAMLQDGRGILCEAKNDIALTKSILQFNREGVSATPEDLRQYALAYFSYEAVGKQYSTLYEQALG